MPPKPPSFAWQSQPGPQDDALSATWCSELFFGGSRGGGKSDYLLGDFLQDVNRYGVWWQGVLFRKTYPEVQELVRRSKQFFPMTGGIWREGDHEWRWANGACLRMRYLERIEDVFRYHGSNFSWIGWDELTHWADREPYDMLKACLRSAGDVKTKRIRATGNPGGVGHNWVKGYFVDPNPLGYEPIKDKQSKMERMFIPSRIQDNQILLLSDPDYVDRLKAVGSPELVRAWLEGDWNVILGSYFPEFSVTKHVVAPVELPSSWVRFGAYDHGSSRPFAFGWFAVADGEYLWDHFPRGALVMYREWYGCKDVNVGLELTAEEIAQGVRDRMQRNEKLAYSVADPSVFKVDSGPSVGERMRNKGVVFRKADNSRLSGWDSLRARLRGIDGIPMLYFFSTCAHTIRTLPSLQHDIRKPEDVDTDGEDHAGDMVRYACMSRPYGRPKEKVKRKKTLGELLSIKDLMSTSTVANKRI